MNRISPEIRSLAERIRAFETSEIVSGGTQAPAAFPTISKLLVCLANLMGQSGSQALLSRALVLAAAECRWLAGVSVSSTGDLEGLTVLQGTPDAAEFAEGQVTVLAQLIRLLVAFIGPTLTLRLLREVWPELSLGHGDLYKLQNHEDAK